MTKQTNPAMDAAGRPVIEITEKMVEMGVLEAREHPLGAPLADLVRSVFIAMSVEFSSQQRLGPLDH